MVAGSKFKHLDEKTSLDDIQAINAMKESAKRDAVGAPEAENASGGSPLRTSLWGGKDSVKRREHQTRGHFPLGLTKSKIKTVLPALMLIQKQARQRREKLEMVHRNI